MFTDAQLSGFKEDVAKAASIHGITADNISITVQTSVVHPIGMPVPNFRAMTGSGGGLLSYRTLRDWERVGKVKTCKISHKNKVVTEFQGRAWNGNAFE